jgi:hypothetical protein
MIILCQQEPHHAIRFPRRAAPRCHDRKRYAWLLSLLTPMLAASGPLRD